MGRISRVSPLVVRSRLLLEVASELVGERDALPSQVKILFRTPGQWQWPVSFTADDSERGVEAVCRGEATAGIANPSSLLAVARRGTHPFRAPLPVSAVCVLPSPDQFVVAVRASTGLTSLEEVAAKRFPLRLSLRGQRDNSVHLVTDHVLEASGLSLGDLRSWGGDISYDDDLPTRGDRIVKAERGEVDAIIDEASATWVEDAIAAGMRIIPLSATALSRLEAWGYRRAMLTTSAFPSLSDEVPTIDFSGFPLYVRDDAPETLVRSLCAALEERRDRIPLQTGEPLPLEVMCTGSSAAPLDIPLHSAARAFWSERGYLR